MTNKKIRCLTSTARSPLSRHVPGVQGEREETEDACGGKETPTFFFRYRASDIAYHVQLGLATDPCQTEKIRCLTSTARSPLSDHIPWSMANKKYRENFAVEIKHRINPSAPPAPPPFSSTISPSHSSAKTSCTAADSAARPPRLASAWPAHGIPSDTLVSCVVSLPPPHRMRKT